MSVVAIDRKDRYLTVGWNNALTAMLGLPAVVFAIVALSTSAFSDLSAFIAMVVIGAFY